jgi:oligoribonuclease
MAQDNNNLIWIDLEMTGLFPERDRIIEIAVVITDSQLNVLAESPVLVVHQSDEMLAGMDAWNTSTHGKSGLTDKVRASSLDEAEAESQMIAFIQQRQAKKSPMCT